MSGSGPYQTQEEAAAGPIRQKVRELFRSPERPEPGAGKRLQLAQLLETCERLGVEVGAYDRRIIEWLADWEAETVQVIVGLMERAHAAGQEAGRPVQKRKG